jgi:putative ABC transport system permease protein
MEFYVVLCNLFRHKLRAILMIISIVVAFALLVVLQSFNRALSYRVQAGSLGRLVTVNAVNFTMPLPLAYVERVRGLAGVRDITHASWFGGYYQDPRNLVSVIAVDPVSYISMFSDELELSDDARRAFLSDRTAILVGEAVATKMQWSPGAVVPISSNIYLRANGSNAWPLKIAGIFRPRRPAGTTTFALMHYDYLNETRTFGRNSISWFVVDPVSADANATLSNAIDAVFANSSIETSTVSEKSFSDEFSAQYRNLGFVVNLVAAAALVTLLFIVGSTMAMNLRERIHEIGVLKTLGFSNWRVLRMLLSETITLSMIGGLPGTGVAYLFITFSHFTLDSIAPGAAVTPAIVAISIASMVLFGMAVGIGPGWSISRLPILAALGST